MFWECQGLCPDKVCQYKTSHGISTGGSGHHEPASHKVEIYSGATNLLTVSKFPSTFSGGEIIAPERDKSIPSTAKPRPFAW